MNREECERAYADLEVCREVMRESIERNGEIINPVSSFDKAMVMFARLIEEHFDNPPLKFDELEEEMWVWDNKEKMYIKSCNNFDTEENGKGIRVQMGFDLVRIKFEENRFYRKQVEE